MYLDCLLVYCRFVNGKNLLTPYFALGLGRFVYTFNGGTNCRRKRQHWGGGRRYGPGVCVSRGYGHSSSYCGAHGGLDRTRRGAIYGLVHVKGGATSNFTIEVTIRVPGERRLGF